MAIVAGVDFGTLSVRVSLVDSDQGKIGTAVCPYPVVRKAGDPAHASQRHEDHLTALISAMQQALATAGVQGTDVRAMAIATTGSTVVPVDEHLQPLDEYYLWCDHRGANEAQRISTTARKERNEAIQWCGNVYSAEFALSKLLHWLRHNPNKRTQFASMFEHCDLIVATLTGVERVRDARRSICAAGHKWMWNERLGGLPSEEFFQAIDPLLAGIRPKLTGNYGFAGEVAGHLSSHWARQLQLKAGIPISVAALDAHWDAMGAGIRLGDVVNVVGTSTCVMAVVEKAEPIPGVFGVVQGSIHPRYAGIEAGMSAVGDIFEAIAKRAGTTVRELSSGLETYKPGETGLMRLTWDNGDRNILSNPKLGGATIGWNLHHTAQDELFAAIEGTAFHTRIILERLQEYGVPIERVIHAGGIPQKNQTLNQVYANVFNRPVLIPDQEITGIGSSIFAFLAAGIFGSVEEAQQRICPGYKTITPEPAAVAVYERLFQLFRQLYFAMGQPDSTPTQLGHLLSTLHEISLAQRALK